METPANGAADAANRALHSWHRANGRDLAFRRAPDAWSVLVAEVMAQQTQVARVDVAWASFMRTFPTPAALAAATPADVVRAWAGLGYNRRAVNLYRAARAIVERHAGDIPSDIGALEALPGVGPYTARAVAATSFGLPVAAIDTNIGRVLRRLMSDGTVSTRDLQAVGDSLVDPGDPGVWTHAMMDLGATVCRPVPACDRCPLAAWCRFAGAVAVGEAMRAPAPAPAPARRTAARFESTSRWLRGRIVARLRDAPDGSWVRLDDPIGIHDAGAVQVAIGALEADGVLERKPDGSVRLPSSA
jgi:A/G-specific adenine glycosylase